MSQLLYAHEIRKAIFAAVPEYKPLKRIFVNGNATDGCEFIRISLQTGLMTNDATEVYDKVGTLPDNIDKIISELKAIYGTRIKRAPELRHDHHARAQCYYLYLR